MGFVKSVTRMWRAFEGQVHLPGYAAVAEVAGRSGAQFRDVLGFREVHFEEAADAGGEWQQVERRLGCLRGLARGDLGAGGVKVRLGLKHIRALLHQSRRET